MASGNMRDIKRRIKSVNSTEHITNAMKLVSAAKLRRSKAAFEKNQTYFSYITESMEGIFRHADRIPPKYVTPYDGTGRSLCVLITSNRGLCGSFNTGVIKLAEEYMAGLAEKPAVITIGSKGRDWCAKNGIEVHLEYNDPPEAITLADAYGLAKEIIRMFNEDGIGEVKLITTEFINTLSQQPTIKTLLPFGSFVSESAERESTAGDVPVEYEPSVEAVFEYLVPKFLEIVLYGTIIESATCEHAARRMAMENATDNAREMLANLSLFYNRARQAAITNEIIEVVSGSEAQK